MVIWAIDCHRENGNSAGLEEHAARRSAEILHKTYEPQAPPTRRQALELRHHSDSHQTCERNCHGENERQIVAHSRSQPGHGREHEDCHTRYRGNPVQNDGVHTIGGFHASPIGKPDTDDVPAHRSPGAGIEEGRDIKQPQRFRRCERRASRARMYFQRKPPQVIWNVITIAAARTRRGSRLGARCQAAEKSTE
jgi:hypothetical protein